MKREENIHKPLEEAAAIAKALEPLGYEVYGIEDTWYAGQVPGLVLKVIRVSVPRELANLTGI
jgi:hypothetical protein